VKRQLVSAIQLQIVAVRMPAVLAQIMANPMSRTFQGPIRQLATALATHLTAHAMLGIVPVLLAQKQRQRSFQVLRRLLVNAEATTKPVHVRKANVLAVDVPSRRIIFHGGCTIIRLLHC